MTTLAQNEIVSLALASQASSVSGVLEGIIAARFGADEARVSNVTYTGSETASFLLGPLNLGALGELAGGLLLSTGTQPGFENTTYGLSGNNELPGDADLEAIITAAYPVADGTFDASVIEFQLDITDPTIRGVELLLNFASEEYEYFWNQKYSDIAAVIVNGKNYAVFNQDALQPLAALTKNAAYFYDNVDAIYPIEYNGFTGTLSLRVPVVQGENSFKIGIADASDRFVDSALLIQNIAAYRGNDVTGELLALVPAYNSRDVLLNTAANELIDLQNGADDIVCTSPSLIANDLIYNFSINDKIIFEGTALTQNHFKLNAETGLVQVDEDLDGEADWDFKLAGELSFGEMTIQSDGTDTEFSFAIPAGYKNGLLSHFSMQSQLQIIYAGYFGRAADKDGFSFWAQQNIEAQEKGQSAELALTNIANSFRPQPETLANYPLLGLSNLDYKNSDALSQLGSFIDNVYTSLFDRAPDQDGKAYWIQQIVTGAVDSGAAVLAIANGATGNDAIAIFNKVEMANIFTTITTAYDLPVDFSLLNAAKNVVSSVNNNGSSTDFSLSLIENYLVSQDIEISILGILYPPA